MLCQFVQEGVDGAWHLAVALGLFIVQLFRMIVTTVVLPVTIAGVLDTRALHRLPFVAVGTIEYTNIAHCGFRKGGVGHRMKQAPALLGRYNACPCARKSSREAHF